jgi:hypothetical protein
VLALRGDEIQPRPADDALGALRKPNLQTLSSGTSIICRASTADGELTTPGVLKLLIEDLFGTFQEGVSPLLIVFERTGIEDGCVVCHPFGLRRPSHLHVTIPGIRLVSG